MNKTELDNKYKAINEAETYLTEPLKFIEFCNTNKILKEYSYLTIKSIIQLKEEYFDFNYFSLGFDFKKQLNIPTDKIEQIKHMGKRFTKTGVENVSLALFDYYKNNLR